MNKKQIRDLLARYEQGKVTAAEKELVDAYILLAEKEKTDFSDEEKDAVKNRLWQKLEPVPATGTKQPVPVMKRFVRIAAVWVLLAALAAAGYVFRYQLADIVNPVAVTTVETGPYETKQVFLPDSTIVTLAQNSSLSYPEKFRGASRSAALNGTAFFHVTPDAEKPFVVKSGKLNVRVLGTSFEVNDRNTGYEASVTVLTGKVQVSQGSQKLALLTANQQLKFDQFSQQANLLKNVNAAEETAWTKKQLVFNETPLAVVIKTLQVFYGMKISVQQNIIKADDTFSGSFERNETKKNVLDVICFSSGLRYTVTKDSTIEIKK